MRLSRHANRLALRLQTEADDSAVPEPCDCEDDAEERQQHAEDVLHCTCPLLTQIGHQHLGGSVMINFGGTNRHKHDHKICRTSYQPQLKVHCIRGRKR